MRPAQAAALTPGDPGPGPFRTPKPVFAVPCSPPPQTLSAGLVLQPESCAVLCARLLDRAESKGRAVELRLNNSPPPAPPAPPTARGRSSRRRRRGGKEKAGQFLLLLLLRETRRDDGQLRQDSGGARRGRRRRCARRRGAVPGISSLTRPRGQGRVRGRRGTVECGGSPARTGMLCRAALCPTPSPSPPAAALPCRGGRRRQRGGRRQRGRRCRQWACEEPTSRQKARSSCWGGRQWRGCGGPRAGGRPAVRARRLVERAVGPGRGRGRGRPLRAARAARGRELVCDVARGAAAPPAAAAARGRGAPEGEFERGSARVAAGAERGRAQGGDRGVRRGRVGRARARAMMNAQSINRFEPVPQFKSAASPRGVAARCSLRSGAERGWAGGRNIIKSEAG